LRKKQNFVEQKNFMSMEKKCVNLIFVFFSDVQHEEALAAAGHLHGGEDVTRGGSREARENCHQQWKLKTWAWAENLGHSSSLNVCCTSMLLII